MLFSLRTLTEDTEVEVTEVTGCCYRREVWVTVACHTRHNSPAPALLAPDTASDETQVIARGINMTGKLKENRSDMQSWRIMNQWKPSIRTLKQ